MLGWTQPTIHRQSTNLDQNVGINNDNKTASSSAFSASACRELKDEIGRVMRHRRNWTYKRSIGVLLCRDNQASLLLP